MINLKKLQNIGQVTNRRKINTKMINQEIVKEITIKIETIVEEIHKRVKMTQTVR